MIILRRPKEGVDLETEIVNVLRYFGVDKKISVFSSFYGKACRLRFRSKHLYSIEYLVSKILLRQKGIRCSIDWTVRDEEQTIASAHKELHFILNA